MKLLIIDDNQDITQMLSKYLTMKGHDCSVTNDGLNGLNMIKNKSFDFIFLDMSMPQYGGSDVINSLEKDGILKDKKIIIFTASAMTTEEAEKLQEKQGIISILRKPVQLQELLSLISK